VTRGIWAVDRPATWFIEMDEGANSSPSWGQIGYPGHQPGGSVHTRI